MSTAPSRGIQPGGVTILVIFAALCLAIFSALSMGAVRADKRLSEKYAAQTSRYYAADSAAEAWLADADRQLAALKKQNDEVAFWQKTAAAFGDAFDPETRQLSFQTKISDAQELRVVVQLTYADTPTEKIVLWSAVTTIDIEFDESMTVWEGEG